MAIQIPAGDLARVKTQEPDQRWPEIVEVRVGWVTKAGLIIYRTEKIGAAEFFGGGGAPLSGDRLVAAIERMRKAGPPPRKKVKR